MLAIKMQIVTQAGRRMWLSSSEIGKIIVSARHATQNQAGRNREEIRTIIRLRCESRHRRGG